MLGAVIPTCCFVKEEVCSGNIIQAADHSKLKCEMKTLERLGLVWLPFPENLHQVKNAVMKNGTTLLIE